MNEGLRPTIFADSSKITEISKLVDLGIISGITTNPLIVAAEAGETDPLEYYHQIAQTFSHFPVSIQLLDQNVSQLLDQARRFASLASNVIIKVPMFGDGRGLTTLSTLTKEGVKVNVTGLMSAEQLSLTLLTDPPPTYVSLFFNRIRDGGGDPEKEIENSRQLIEKLKSPAQIIVGSIRKGEDVRQALGAGGHIVTVTPKVIFEMIFHPKSEEFIKQSQKAWEELVEKKS